MIYITSGFSELLQSKSTRPIIRSSFCTSKNKLHSKYGFAYQAIYINNSISKIEKKAIPGKHRKLNDENLNKAIPGKHRNLNDGSMSNHNLSYWSSI